ncbi:MAG: IS66 family insertion sequence element accessory protein TnpB [Sphingobacterium sp.]
MSLIHLPVNVRYYLYNLPTDMRCTFCGLTNRIRSELGRSPLSGDLFIFFNKRRDQIKILGWENDGYVICHKRLEKGTFELPQPVGDGNEVQLTPEQLQFILQGVVLSSIQHRKRYLHPA